MLKRAGLVFALILGLFSSSPAEAAATACPTTYCNLATSFFKIGNGSENSVNTAGFLQQPWYYSSTASAWRQYTFSNGAYQTAFGVGTGGSAWNGNVYLTNPAGTLSFDYSGFVVTSTSGSVSTGYGTISVTNTVTINSISFSIKHDFTLGQTARFLRAVVTVTNNSASTATNFNQWVGPTDDYSGGCDGNTKDRGHIAGDVFTILSSATATNQNAVRITCSGVAESEYLTSPVSGAKTIIPSGRFGGVPTGNPTTTNLISETSDNGYGLQIPLGDIPANGTKSAVWYLAGAANADLTSSVMNAIAAPLAPSVASLNPNTSLNNSGNFTYSITFSGSVTGLATGDFSFSGTGSSTCTTSSLTGSGTSYSLSVTGCSEGQVVATLAANSVMDASSSAGPTNPYNASSVRVDQTAPTVASVTTTNGNYSAALLPNLSLTVSFNESVTVTGTPRIPITIGTSTEYASFLSMTDSKTATFRFIVTIDYNDIDLDGIAVLSPLETNTGTISDLATNAMTNFTFTSPVTTGVNVYQPPSAPTIDSITANNTSLTIYFTAGASNGSSVTNYQFSTNNGGSFSVLSPTDAASPITLTGLTNGTTYQIVIKAISNLGVGLASNMLSSAPTASATVNISLTASATTASKGTPITITAQVNQAGVITFFWNGKRISGCIKKSATTSATCIWKPTVTGQWSIQALLDPTDPTYVNSYSAKLPVFILKRAGLR
jgi:hypothetical protein